MVECPICYRDYSSCVGDLLILEILYQHWCPMSSGVEGMVRITVKGLFQQGSRNLEDNCLRSILGPKGEWSDSEAVGTSGTGAGR